MQQFRKVAFYTLGCKLNFSETSTISRLFEDGGYARVEFDQTPDVFVINTCSVTDQADKKCRNIVKRALRVNPNAFVAVVGCYAQLKPAEIAAIPGVDVVLGANEKFNILEHIGIEKFIQGETRWTPIKEVKSFIPGYSLGDRTRTFMKVQDGCDYFCSFCTIPLARGRSRSADVATTVAQAKEIAATNVKEIVLTGVNIGDFGAGTEESFLDLIVALDEVEGIDRFRISSIEPNLLSNDIIDFVASSKRFMPHFHIPLQSGSDRMLEKMRRRYDSALYRNRIDRIKQAMPDACVGVDVITGFPGETEAHFMETFELLHQLDVSYLHVFTYSERANTTAVRMDEIVPMEERRERTKRLQILSEKKKRHFYQQQQGKDALVLFEQDDHDGYMQGYTKNYVRVSAVYSPALLNQLVPVKLDRIDHEGNYIPTLLHEQPA